MKGIRDEVAPDRHPRRHRRPAPLRVQRAGQQRRAPRRGYRPAGRQRAAVLRHRVRSGFIRRLPPPPAPRRPVPRRPVPRRPVPRPRAPLSSPRPLPRSARRAPRRSACPGTWARRSRRRATLVTASTSTSTSRISTTFPAPSTGTRGYHWRAACLSPGSACPPWRTWPLPPARHPPARRHRLRPAADRAGGDLPASTMPAQARGLPGHHPAEPDGRDPDLLRCHRVRQAGAPADRRCRPARNQPLTGAAAALTPAAPLGPGQLLARAERLRVACAAVARRTARAGPARHGLALGDQSANATAPNNEGRGHLGRPGSYAGQGERRERKDLADAQDASQGCGRLSSRGREAR